MKMVLENGTWGFCFYYDDPDFPEQLRIWLQAVDAADLVVSVLVSWLAEQRVMGNAYVISEDMALYSGAERIVSQFNRRMCEYDLFLEETGILS